MARLEEKSALDQKSVGSTDNPQESSQDSLDENSKSKQEKKEKANQVIKEMMVENFQDIRVCENLGQSKNFSDQNNIQFEKLFIENDRTDSVAEALRIPLKSIFQQDYMQSLFDEVFRYENETSRLDKKEKESFLQKAGFYSKVAWTVGQLYKDKAQFEKLTDRSSHLMLLTRIAMLKPELANDPQIKDFCYQLQNSIAENQAVDLKEERKEILKIIDYAGVTVEQLKFDPNKFTEFKMKSDKEGFSFSLSNQPEK